MKIIIFGLQGMQMINIMKESNIPFASLYDYNESSTLDGAKIIIGSYFIYNLQYIYNNTSLLHLSNILGLYLISGQEIILKY